MRNRGSAVQPVRGPPARTRPGAVWALAAACCLLGAARAAAAADACTWESDCPQGQAECSCTAFIDEIAHYRLRFAEPLVRLPLPPPADAGAAVDLARRASFASADGRFRLETWGLPGGPGASGRSPAARLREPALSGQAGASEAGWRVTYRASGASWAVASGYTPSGHVFYERIDLMCAGASVTGFIAVWPADPASRARFDHWVGGARIGAYRC